MAVQTPLGHCKLRKHVSYHHILAHSYRDTSLKQLVAINGIQLLDHMINRDDITGSHRQENTSPTFNNDDNITESSWDKLSAFALINFSGDITSDK